ncbi:hypothetical protein GCM10008944_20590 [Cytobacillus oceanisediminis]
MSKDEGQERARLLAILPDEGAVAGEIFAAAESLGEPGGEFTPALAEAATQVAGSKAAAAWLHEGHSMDDLATLRRYYTYIGERIVTDLGPDGRLAGMVLPGGTQAADSSEQLPHVGAEIERGIRSEPALDSEPTSLIATAGGLIYGTFEDFKTSRFAKRYDGNWVLNHYAAEGVLALQFMGRNFSAFVEVFKDDIASARIVGKGLNLVVEVFDHQNHVITAVGPKKRLRSIFQQLEHPL